MVLEFITGNNNKFLEAKKLLDPIKLNQKEIDLVEIQSLDAKEVVKHKLIEAQKHHKGEFVIEDASIDFEALNGFPGPLFKFMVNSIGRQKLFDICDNFGNTNASARAIVGYSNGTGTKFFEGIIKGKIVAPKGESTFGWDPIFIPEGHTKTFAEMGKEEKNKISHRSIAFKKFKLWYEEQL